MRAIKEGKDSFESSPSVLLRFLAVLQDFDGDVEVVVGNAFELAADLVAALDLTRFCESIYCSRCEDSSTLQGGLAGFAEVGSDLACGCLDVHDGPFGWVEVVII